MYPNTKLPILKPKLIKINCIFCKQLIMPYENQFYHKSCIFRLNKNNLKTHFRIIE